MNRFSAIAVVSLFALFGNLTAVDAQELSEQDKEFMKEAAQGSMMEVRLGEIAKEKAQNENVKQFGERMVRDHSKANEELKEIAKQTDVSLPEDLDDKHKRAIEKLSGLSGKEFDRMYMSEMVKDHKKDIEAFKKAAQQGRHPKVKEFASNTVETLEEHGRLAKDINQQLGGQGEEKAGSPAESHQKGSRPAGQ